MEEYTKAAILVAVRSKVMSRDAALQRYTLTSNEFSIWERAYDDQASLGLRDRRLNARRLGAPIRQLIFELSRVPYVSASDCLTDRHRYSNAILVNQYRDVKAF